jgi:hypothetical protein
MLIGGFASIYYGVNRNTGDLDILFEPTQENGLRLIEALKSIHLETPDFTAREFEENLVLAFGFPPDAVDLINNTPGINFKDAYENSLKINLDGLSIRVIEINDLIRNKENLKRTDEKAYLDKYDIEKLKKILDKNQDKT